MGKKKSVRAEQREKYKAEIKKLIENVGEWNINFYQLSKEWGVPDTTVYRWRDDVLEEIGLVDVKKIGREIVNATVSNLKLLQRLKNKAHYNKKSPIPYIKSMNETAKHLTEFLENYKYKEKVAESIKIGGEIKTISESSVKKWVNEIKKRTNKSNKTNKK